MHRRLSALRLVCAGGRAAGLRARAGLHNYDFPTASTHLHYYALAHRKFMHSFVLDSTVHGKAAFQSSNPGVAFCPTNLYTYLTEGNQIDSDPLQLEALEKLEVIYEALLNSRLPPKRSLYIYGPAGSGKSMVMDLFHFCLEQSKVRARRQHFHEFLYEMHQKLHKLHLNQRNVSTHEFIRQIASDLAKELKVLCFDELAISTIQDCTLLVPLVSQLFQTNICLVTTSNRHPNNLYEDGLNRHLYLPAFLKALYVNAELANVKSMDYREREFLKDHSLENISKVFFSTSEAAKAEGLLAGLGLTGEALDLTIGYNRKMLVENCSADRTAALFDAKKLFAGPPFWSADDYNAICSQFQTIVLDGLWVLDMADHNEAKRLTNFLDCAYEMHVRVVCVNMEVLDVWVLFKNLLPLESLSLQEILDAGKQTEEGTETLAAVEKGALPRRDRIGQNGSVSASIGEHTTPQLAQQQSPGDTDSATSSMAELVKSIKDLPVANSQQSCYFLSKDHKDWSVESAIVQTSDRKASAGVNTKSGTMQARVRSSLLGQLHKVLPKEPDQSGRSKPLPTLGAPRADSATTFDDASSEQHSVKGVFVAAVASLHEAGFAVKRAISRLQEMQTTKYLEAHKAKHMTRAVHVHAAPVTTTHAHAV